MDSPPMQGGRNLYVMMENGKEQETNRNRKCSCFDRLKEKRWFRPIWTIIRLLIVFILFYFFICAINMMSDAFHLIAGVKLGRLFRDNVYLQNPVIDLMIGALVSVLIQSSETVTVIMISMTAANVVPLDNSIYVLFGTEIGQSIVTMLVAFSHITDRTEFRRAFSASSMSSLFNWFCTIIFFPLEVTTHFMRRIAQWITQSMNPHSDANTATEAENIGLNGIISPFTDKIIQLDPDLIAKVATNELNETNYTTLIIPDGHFLFSNTTLPDVWVGIILLICVLILLFLSLAGISKLMSSLLKTHVASLMKKYINTDLPGCWKHLTGYLAMLCAAIITALLQSSTVFTSILTSMVGIGLVTVDRAWPLIIGANIGDSLGDILGALAQNPDVIQLAMTVALFQILFDLLGVIVFYPIPFFRNMIVKTAKWLGRHTCQYRWFSFVYVFMVFIFVPLLGICISLGGLTLTYCLAIPLLVFIILIGLINAIQSQKPSLLPEKLRNWDWLPAQLHSLEPYDRFFHKFCCLCCKNLTKHHSDTYAIEDGQYQDEKIARKQVEMETDYENTKL